MPTTAMMSCQTPGSLFSTLAAATAARSTMSPVCADALVVLPAPLVSSHEAVRLLKNSEDVSRFIGGCLDRAMATECNCEEADSETNRMRRQGSGRRIYMLKRKKRRKSD